MEEIAENIFRRGEKLFTRAASEKSVYGEDFSEIDGEIYREWNPSRSKAAAAIRNGLKLEIGRDSNILYLGAASGTTVSHFSDIVTEGFILAVEYSEEVVRDLLEVAEHRENIAPILGNARNPEEYSEYIDSCDIVFQDISQSDQVEIFTKNCDRYLNEDGIGLLVIKARSISTSEEPDEIFEDAKDSLEDDFKITDDTRLEPFEKDHLFLKLEKKR